MKRESIKMKRAISICAILSLVFFNGCSGKALSKIGNYLETQSGQKYYVEADFSLSDEELENLRKAVFIRARVLSVETLTETGRDSKGDYIRVEFPEGSPDSYYKLLEEHPRLHFFLNYKTEEEEEVLLNTRLEAADTYAYGDSQNEQYFLNMVFDEEKKEELAEVTAEHIGDKIAICLDDWIICEPVIGAKITDGVVTVTGMEKSQLQEAAVLLLGSGQDYDIKREP